jgi:hypothetical protein
MSLGVPSDIAIKLGRFYNLPREKRKIWLTACHWLAPTRIRRSLGFAVGRFRRTGHGR